MKRIGVKFLRILVVLWGAAVLFTAGGPAFPASFPVGRVPPPKNRIPLERAREKAVKVQAGEIKSEKLVLRKKVWVYSFDIWGKDRKIHEVNVNALSGEILFRGIHTPASKVREIRADMTATPSRGKR